MAEAPATPRAVVARGSIGVVLVIAAVALAMFGFSADRRERSLREGAVRTTGTVVGVVQRQKGNAPLVRFVTPGGDRIDFTASDAGATQYQVGDQVTVFYHPDNPGFAGLESGRSRWQRVAFFGVAAAICAILGVRLTWSTR